MKTVIKRLIYFRMQTHIIVLLSLVATYANAQCSFENLSYTTKTVKNDEVTICYQFKAIQTIDSYEIFINNVKVKTATYATLSQKFNQQVSNSNFQNTCFTVSKQSLLAKNVLKVQDETDKTCNAELEFDLIFAADDVPANLLNGQEVAELSSDFGLLGNKQSGIPMGVLLPHKNIVANTTVELPIMLGSEAVPVEGLQGIAFSLHLDTKITSIDHVEIDFTNSWLGQDGDQLTTLSTFDAQTGKLNVGLSKTNGSSINGYGNIATLRIIILIEIEPEKRASNFFSVAIEDILISTKSEGFEHINQKGINLISSPKAEIIRSANAEVDNAVQIKNKVHLFPTITSQFFQIENNFDKEMDCRIFDLIGNTMYKGSIANHLTTINTSQWVSGLYIVNITIENQTYRKRIVIRH